jgi:RAB protein geranylgeranyltransferase component A
MNFIAYIVCNYQHSFSKPLPEHVRESFKVKNFIERFGKFINSCGIYGESPYLYVDNGMGDIPQAFSRIASIFGSTFILHPKLTLDSIEETEDGVRVRSNIVPGKELKVKQLFYGETFEGLYGSNNKNLVLER